MTAVLEAHKRSVNRVACKVPRKPTAMFIDLSMKHMYTGTCLHILVYITSILLHVLIRA